MSHYSKFKTAFNDEKCLVKALCHLKNRNGTVLRESMIELHDEAVHLYGYQNDQREQVANVIIRRKNVGGAANDVGWVKNAEGSYEAIISEYDSGHYNQAWNTELTMWYNYEKSKDEVTAHGMTYTETQTEDGRMQLKCRFRQHQTENPEAITL